jgi:hypothetical protein
VAVYTLFSQGATGTSGVAADPTAYTMGVQFSVSVSGGTLTAVYFYSDTGAAVLPQAIALYAVSGASLVHSESASWSGLAGTGWVRAAFASPPSLTSGAAYKACVEQSTVANWYSLTASYWTSGAGGSGITNGPLSAPGNAGGDGGQDTFSTSVPAYPNSSFNASNYWVDPEVTTTGANVTGVAAQVTIQGGIGAAGGGANVTGVAAQVTVAGGIGAALAQALFPAGSVFIPGYARPGWATPGNATAGTPANVTGAVLFTCGTPYSGWATGTPYFQWAAGDPYLS